MTKEILWLNSDSTISKESEKLGRIFIIAAGGLAANFYLSSIISVHMVFRTFLNTINVLSLNL